MAGLCYMNRGCSQTKGLSSHHVVVDFGGQVFVIAATYAHAWDLGLHLLPGLGGHLTCRHSRLGSYWCDTAQAR